MNETDHQKALSDLLNISHGLLGRGQSEKASWPEIYAAIGRMQRDAEYGRMMSLPEIHGTENVQVQGLGGPNPTNT